MKKAKRTRMRYFSGIDSEAEPMLVETEVDIGSPADRAEASVIGARFGMLEAEEITKAECDKIARQLAEKQNARSA